MTGQQHDASRIRLVRRIERAAILDRLGTIFTVVGGLLVALGMGSLAVLAVEPASGWLERVPGPTVWVEDPLVATETGEDASAESSYLPTPVAVAPEPTPIRISPNRQAEGVGQQADVAGPSFGLTREATAPAPTDAPTFAPIPAAPTPLPSPVAEPIPFLRITRVVVPRISLSADVVPANFRDQGGGLTWEVPDFKAGHAEATAGAGGVGNAVLLGHLASRRAGNVFKDLGKARVGDRVQVFSGEQQFNYRVMEVREVDRTDLSVAEPTETTSLSLITCTGIWLPFIRDYTKRLVVRAELTDVVVPVPQPAPSRAAVFHTVFEEEFADGRHGWPNDPIATAWIADGGYRLFAREPGRFVAVGAPIAKVLGDVVVSGTFRKLGGPPGGGYGLIVRDQGPGSRDGINQGGRYYVLEVGDRGELGIWRREEDHWVDLIPWTPSDVVRPGGTANELMVQAVGQQLTFLVNGIRVASEVDAVLGEGAVGIFAGGDFNDVAVDRFVVRVPR